MKRLEDIQKNPSEFIVSFHMKELIGYAMMTVFTDEDNKRLMEDTVRIAMKIKPAEFRLAIIGSKFNEIIDGFLSEEME